jgi:hypothetical protein
MSLLARLLMLLALALLLAWSGAGHAESWSVAPGAHARLRAAASAGGAVLAVLPPGTPVRLLEEKGDYVRVVAGNKKGWVAKRLLAAKEVPSARAPAFRAAPEKDQPAPPRRSAPLDGAGEARVHRDELALMREEQEKNTWRMIGTTAGVALASFVTGFWLRGAIFRQRYGWLGKERRAARQEMK